MNKNMICCKCKQRPAVIFVTKMEGEKTTNEGYCIQCAMEMNIGPIKQISRQKQQIAVLFQGQFCNLTRNFPQLLSEKAGLLFIAPGHRRIQMPVSAV